MDGDRVICGVENGLSRRAALAAASGNAAAMKSQNDVHPDTPHAFNADYRPSYRKEDGWKKALAWFKANGVG
jgi:carboxymethylenebutenolidase